MARKKLVGLDSPDMDTSLFKSVGGKRITLGDKGGEVWNFGWVPRENRTEKQQARVHAATVAMPRFAISGDPLRDDQKKVALFEYWKHPDVVAANNGKLFTGIHPVSYTHLTLPTILRV